MTLGERIKKARRALDLTQQKFAEQIGTTQNNIASYEIGRREPSAAAINNICKTFDISEKWLRTGEGEMLLAKPTAALDALAVEHSLSISDYTLIEKFLALKPESRKTITDLMMEFSTSISSMAAEDTLADDPAFPSSLSHGIPRTMEELDEQAVNFRAGLVMDVRHRQRQEEQQEPPSDPEIEADVEAYRQRRIQEKRPGSQTSAAKESAEG